MLAVLLFTLIYSAPNSFCRYSFIIRISYRTVRRWMENSSAILDISIWPSSDSIFSSYFCLIFISLPLLHYRSFTVIIKFNNFHLIGCKFYTILHNSRYLKQKNRSQTENTLSIQLLLFFQKYKRRNYLQAVYAFLSFASSSNTTSFTTLI